MDYTSGPYTVTFLAGQTTATFNISIINNDIAEGNENFMLNINETSLLTGITRGDPGGSTVLIVDNDNMNETCKTMGRLF